MENKTLEEVAKELKENNKGMVTGEVMRIEGDYVIYREGEEGLEKVKKKMLEMGVEIDFSKIKSAAWEEEWKNSLFILTCKEVFNWSDDDIFDMGKFSPRASFFIKTIVQHLRSIDIVFNNANKYWRKHHNFGELEAVELNHEEKYLILRKKGFYTHSVMCTYHAGYFLGLAEFVLGRGNVNIEETKCMHKGDPYHEYKITWQ